MSGDKPTAQLQVRSQVFSALSGPREVVSLMLSFEDGDNLASVWSASISQVVENQNQPALDNVRRKLEPGIARALRVLPHAPTP